MRLIIYSLGLVDEKYLEAIAKGKDLIIKLSSGEMSKEEALKLVDKKTLNALLGRDIVLEKNKILHLNLTYFTWEEVKQLRDLGIEYGRKVADMVEEMAEGIDEKLSKLKCYSRDKLGILRFAIIGCHSLNLGFFRTLKWELRHKKPIPYVREVEPEEWREMIKDFYWKSCSGSLGRYCFYSFGNPIGKRKCLPDLVLNKEISLKEAYEIEKAVRRYYEKGRREAREILMKYGYEDVLFIPKADLRPTGEIVAEFALKVRDKTKEWRDLYSTLEGFKASKNTSVEHVFIEAWRWISGWAIKELIDREYFCPPVEGEEGAKYVYWISYRSQGLNPRRGPAL